jgi:parvulin-like peptidyl-prolyl isomerase
MGSVELTAKQIKELIDAQSPEVRSTLRGSLDAKKALVTGELLRQSLIAEARKAELDKRTDVAITMERAREQALVDIYLNERAQPPASYPSAKEIESTYEANKSQFRVPPQVHLAQILLRVPEQSTKDKTEKIATLAREIHTKLSKGGRFSEFVSLYSEDEGTKDKDGDLGWFSVEVLQAHLRAEVLALNPGEHTKPLRTPYGWQIIKLLEAKPEQTQPLPDVRKAIVKALREAKAQENRNRHMDSLSKETPMTIEEAALLDLDKK